MINVALVKMNGLCAGMYETDIKGGRPSIATEKRLHRNAAADLLQRALRAPAHGADSVQVVVPLVC